MTKCGFRPTLLAFLLIASQYSVPIAYYVDNKMAIRELISLSQTSTPIYSQLVSTILLKTPKKCSNESKV